jgi:Flp pilus assembly protein TadG
VTNRGAAERGVRTRIRGTAERGQALAEFSVAIPLLALILFAIFEFGNLLLTQIQIQNAVREGARFMALGGPANYHGTGVTGGGTTGCPALADVQTVVRGAAGGLGITVTDSYNPSPCGACTQLTALPELTASGTYSYIPITPAGSLFAWFSGIFASSITLSSHSTLYYEACG